MAWINLLRAFGLFPLHHCLHKSIDSQFLQLVMGASWLEFEDGAAWSAAFHIGPVAFVSSENLHSPSGQVRNFFVHIIDAEGDMVYAISPFTEEIIEQPPGLVLSLPLHGLREFKLHRTDEDRGKPHAGRIKKSPRTKAKQV